jgi:DNA-binding MarR family transcriptional regulator
MIVGMNRRLPLSTLLSQTLVAFTIEFDNEFERRTPHRTTNHGSAPASTHGLRSLPWLVSMAMWSHFLQFVPEEGVSIRELQAKLRVDDKFLQSWLERLGPWWSYITVESGLPGSHAKRHPPDALVRLTPGGRVAVGVWKPLAAEIERRWSQRFGPENIDRLRETLVEFARLVSAEFKHNLPEYLPILGYGLFSQPQQQKHQPPPAGFADPSAHSLAASLSKVLLAFAIEFESKSEVSLAICANVLRLAGESGVRLRDLPRLSGVSKEAIAMSLSFLEKQGYAVFEPESQGGKAKIVALTPKGHLAHHACQTLLSSIEESWQLRFGTNTVLSLRAQLESLAGVSNDSCDPSQSPLFRGLEPYPNGWRASLPRPETLPHYPMVLHRGGFPDGS